MKQQFVCVCVWQDSEHLKKMNGIKQKQRSIRAVGLAPLRGVWSNL